MTLIDVLVGAAIGVVLLGIVVSAAFAMTRTAAHLDTTVASTSAANALAQRLESEAASAWAVYVPENDALGNANADGHALAFYTQDGQHKTYGWQYVWDAQAHTVTRYTYDPSSPQTSALASDSTGSVTAFSAREATVDDLRTLQSDAYDPLFASASVTDASFTYAPGIVGGNRLVVVTYRVGNAERTQRLAAATAPSSFTIAIDYTPSPPPAPPTPATAPPTSVAQTPTPDATPSIAPTTAPSTPTASPTASGTPSATPPPPLPQCAGTNPCAFVSAWSGTSERANCQTGLDACWQEYAYGAIDSSGGLPTSLLTTCCVAYTDSNGIPTLAPPGTTSPGDSLDTTGETGCYRAAISDTQQNNGESGWGQRYFYFMLVTSSSPYSTNMSIDDIVQNASSGYPQIRREC